jgi:Rubisco LSMT substrate-binding
LSSVRQHQNHATSSIDDLGVNAVKRVRVCVSNNENTRLLFSLLRTLACTRDEIRAVSQPGHHLHHHASVPAVGATAISRASLFGLPDATRQYPYSSSPSTPLSHLHAAPRVVLTGSPAPIGTTFYRSCRDIRHPLSLRNEQEAMRILLDTVQTLLARYPTTIQEDIEALNNEVAYPKFSNQRHARIQVRGEKQVLHHFAAWATTALQVLDVIEAELAEEAHHGGGSGALSGDIEVRWRSHQHLSGVVGGHGSTRRIHDTTYGDTSHRHADYLVSIREPSFDLMIRQIEEDMDDEGAVHHTILRYCADVLGSLRREEFRNLRRRLQRQRSGSNSSTTSTLSNHRASVLRNSRHGGDNGAGSAGSGYA